MKRKYRKREPLPPLVRLENGLLSLLHICDRSPQSAVILDRPALKSMLKDVQQAAKIKPPI